MAVRGSLRTSDADRAAEGAHMSDPFSTPLAPGEQPTRPEPLDPTPVEPLAPVPDEPLAPNPEEPLAPNPQEPTIPL